MIFSMKSLTNSAEVLTDDAYYVSAAAVADKIIDRMQRGLDPLLMRRPMLAFIPADSGFGACFHRKPD
jgi:hypothetical protein